MNVKTFRLFLCFLFLHQHGLYSPFGLNYCIVAYWLEVIKHHRNRVEFGVTDPSGICCAVIYTDPRLLRVDISTNLIADKNFLIAGHE
jgi:hypothetical protein